MRRLSSIMTMLFGTGAMLLGVVRLWDSSTFVDGVVLASLGLLVLDSGGRTLHEGGADP